MIIEKPLEVGQPRRKVWCSSSEIVAGANDTYTFVNLPVDALGFGSIVFVIDSPGLILYYDNTDGTLYKKPNISINGLTNVDITNPQNGQILEYDTNSGNWVNSNNNLVDLADVNTSSLANGQILVYDSNSGKFVNQANDGTDLTFEFTQSTAATTWNIEHNMNKYPSVNIVDSNNITIIADVEYVDVNNITITFTTAMTGKAYLN